MEKIEDLAIRQTSRGSNEWTIRYNILFDKRKPNHEEVVSRILQLIADKWVAERLELNRFTNKADSESSIGELRAKLQLAQDGAAVVGAVKNVAGFGKVILKKKLHTTYR